MVKPISFPFSLSIPPSRNSNLPVNFSRLQPIMARTTRSTNKKPGLMSRLTGSNKSRSTTTTKTETKTNPLTGKSKKTTTTTRTGDTTAGPIHHHQRKPTVGDKISGFGMKLRGSLTGKSGLKVYSTDSLRYRDPCLLL